MGNITSQFFWNTVDQKSHVHYVDIKKFTFPKIDPETHYMFS